MIIEDENQKWNFKSWKVEVGKSKKYYKSKNVWKNSKCPKRITESALVACIKWSIVLNDHWRWKSKMKFEISKVEKLKSENQKQVRMAKWDLERYKNAVRVCVRLNWMIIKDENKKWNLQSKKVEVGK